MPMRSSAFCKRRSVAACPSASAPRIRASRVLDREVEAVLHRQQFLCEPLDAETVRLFDIALGALADVVELGDRTQVLVALLLAARLGIGEQRLEIVQRQTLARLGGGGRRGIRRVRRGGVRHQKAL
jgi:hypothetical protein